MQPKAYNFLDTPIEYLKGVGPPRAPLLKKDIGVFTFGDLLKHYPFRYVDRSKFIKINEINSDLVHIQIKGRILRTELIGGAKQQRLVAQFSDGTGILELVWFQGIKWATGILKGDKEYIVFGKPTLFHDHYQITHPEIEEPEEDNGLTNPGLQPVYSSTEKLKSYFLDSRGIRRLIINLISQLQGRVSETLSTEIIRESRLMTKQEALIGIHIPPNEEVLKRAILRLKFEELFFVQLQLLRLNLLHKSEYQGFVFSKIGDCFNNFYSQNLPFQLTNAQKRVLKEIRMDLGSGRQMNRLLQGDVGSGKTMVALMTMLIALDNGYQACLMAPTEILANQHFNTISRFLEGLNISVTLLTGSTKKSKRKVIHETLLSGEVNIIIGTHALIEEVVKFKNLGMVVIDEQHRFGVEQRAKLWKKNIHPPHVLIMTATPIPRTLAMTLYGDLDTSVIDELPPGRTPIKTAHRFDSHRLSVFGFMKEQIKLGRQIYVVYPLIEESETMDYKDLMDGFEGIERAFPKPDYQVSILHGKMGSVEKDFEMQRFKRGETDIMVATTVIEVGVDVPNASVMVIESAERFGLSQLHQLRGRVGRGADQSYCILMTSFKLSNEAKQRIETMVRTNDGFEIAETDMQLRGPGDMAGTQQSGLPDFKLTNLAKDGELLKHARYIAQKLLANDPLLEKTENAMIVEEIRNMKRGKENFSKIS